MREGRSGVSLEYLRMNPGPTIVHHPKRVPTARRSPLLTLGKATVYLYVILLLVAVISARVLPQAEDSHPAPRSTEVAQTPSPATAT